jgi:F-type H+-transporting ATPase subunit b
VAAAAQDEPVGEPGSEAEHGELSHVGECVEEAVAAGQDPEDCVEAPSPILPATNEIVWGSLSFVILMVLMAKVALPSVRKMMEGRTERIRDSLDSAERTRTEADRILDQYQRQLADAKNEAARVIEEARQTADAMRRDLQSRAEAEAAELRQRAQDDIQAATDRAMADLRAQVAQLSLDLAEKVVGANLDRDANLRLIENYINEVGGTRSS